MHPTCCDWTVSPVGGATASVGLASSVMVLILLFTISYSKLKDQSMKPDRNVYKSKSVCTISKE